MSQHANLALLSVAITPNTSADTQKLARGLQRLAAEDAALRVRTGPETGTVWIAASSELHLEVVIDRLTREFGVEAGVGRPQVCYRAGLSHAAEGEIKLARQSGGRSAYAHVKIRVWPGAPGSGCTVVSRIADEMIPRAFIEGARYGVREALAGGVLAGYPVDDVHVELYDGSYHDADSSVDAFRLAGSLAVHDATRKAGPILLEPVMRIDVCAPAGCEEDVMKNIMSRRGLIRSVQDVQNIRVIRAAVPLAELFGYETDLRGRTSGRGTWAMQFEAYQPCPPADDGDEDRDSVVGAPRRPQPKLKTSSAAVPEPLDDDSERDADSEPGRSPSR